MKNIKQIIIDKIVENKDKVDNDLFLQEFAGLKPNLKCSQNECVVNEEFNLDDLLDETNLTSIGHSEIDHTNFTISEPFKHKLRNVIYRLNLISNHVYKDQVTTHPSSNSAVQSFYDYSKSFIKFINCINGPGKQSIKKFDMNTFYEIFSSDYNDENITTFIRNMVDDPLCYEEDCKQDIIVILIYIVTYCSKLKLKYSHQVFNKLKTCIVFAKTTNKYRVKTTNDYFIDKYVLKIKKIELEYSHQIYEESVFLNYFFTKFISKTNLDREVFNDFQLRIQKIISFLEEEYIVSFLKNVFFKHSVLFACVSNEQLINSIIDIYYKIIQKQQSEAVHKGVYCFVVSLVQAIPSVELSNLLVEKGKLIFQGEKYILLSLFSITNLTQIQTMLEDYKESFTCIKQIVDFYYNLLSVSIYNEFKKEKGKMRTVCEFLDVHLFIFREIQTSFLVKIFNKHTRGLISLLEIVHQSIKAKEEDIMNYININQQYWDSLSKVVLQIEKYIILFDEEAKKEKKKENSQPLTKILNNLLSVIYKIEESLVLEGKENDIVLLKSRSFKITDDKKDI